MNQELIGYGRTAEIFSWGEGKILKLFHEFMPRFEVEQEFAVGQRIHAVGVPAPRPFEILQIDERLGIVYQRLNGQTMLDILKAHPLSGIRQARQLARLHHQIHQAHNSDLPKQKELIKRNINYTPALDSEKKEIILRYLDSLEEGNTICHGDLHPDNIMVTKDNYWVIDWMTASCGSPAADVARTLLIMRTGCPSGTTIEAKLLYCLAAVVCRAYLREYRRISGISRKGIDAWTLPLAAARLTENLPENELRQVLKIIGREMKRLKLA